MDSFRTEIKDTRRPYIDHRTRLFTSGSCFADNLGEALHVNKFKVLVNPFGVTYNPISIHQQIVNSVSGKSIAPELFVEKESVWSHFDFHSKWNALSREAIEAHLSDLIATTGESLRHTDMLLITYGTAWVYEHNATGHIVSNCHKAPQSLFSRRLLSAKEIVESFNEMYRQLKMTNPKVKLVLTLSPVRHVRDGLVSNHVAKSTIMVAIDEIVNTCPQASYFPAYEIMMDDLRDYRFYDSDLIHPSATAQEYIWKKFQNELITDESISLIARWAALRKALDHRAFQPNAPSHQKFVVETLSKLKEISRELDVGAEIEQFSLLHFRKNDAEQGR